MEPNHIGAAASLNEPLRRRVYDVVADTGEVNRGSVAEVLGVQGSALVVGDDDLDRLHTGHHRGTTADTATGSFATAGCCLLRHFPRP